MTTELTPIKTKKPPSKTQIKKFKRSLKTRAIAACASTRHLLKHPRLLDDKKPPYETKYTRAEMRAYNRLQMQRESRRRNGASSA